jgi:hypothetical protein
VVDEETSALARTFPPYVGDRPFLLKRMPPNGSGDPGEPALLEERRGKQLWIRARQEGDPEGADPIVVKRGDVVIPFIPVPWVGLHRSATPGDNSSFLLGMPLIETERDDDRKIVFARTRHLSEPMPLVSQRWPYGYDFQLPASGVSVEIEWIDEQVVEDADGWRPLTDTLWTWMSIGEMRGDGSLARYLLATARRLDGAHRALYRATSCLSGLTPETPGPYLRSGVFQYLAEVETCVISLHRSLEMASKISSVADVTTPVPKAVSSLTARMKDFRDAYEHIDERAKGLVKMKPDPQAVSIFDWEPVLGGTLTYRGVAITLDEIEAAMEVLRSYLKTAASEGLESIAKVSATS